MIPHPAAWQGAAERDRRQLLAAAERYRRESAALAMASRGPAASPRVRRAEATRPHARLSRALGGFRPRRRRPGLLMRLAARLA